MKNSHWLWLKFNTSKLLAFSSPSGTSFSLLCERSKVVNSNKLKSSLGTPDVLMLLCLMFKLRRLINSVSSPYNFSISLFFMERCSSFPNLPNSSGISLMSVLSSLRYCRPDIRAKFSGNSFCKVSKIMSKFSALMRTNLR